MVLAGCSMLIAWSAISTLQYSSFRRFTKTSVENEEPVVCLAVGRIFECSCKKDRVDPEVVNHRPADIFMLTMQGIDDVGGRKSPSGSPTNSLKGFLSAL